MPKMNTNPFSKYFFLSGERWVTAKRVFRTDTVLVLVLLIVTLAFVDSYPIVLVVFLVANLFWTWFRIVRGETFYQLRIKEIKAAKEEARIAQDELQDYAESLSRKDGSEQAV